MSSHKVLIHLIHHLESILVVATFGQWEGKQTDTGKSWTTLGVVVGSLEREGGLTQVCTSDAWVRI